MFIVVQKTAKMPSSVRAPYVRLGVVELTPDAPAGYVPPMLSDRSRYVARVVETWESLPANGRTPRSALVQAQTEAAALAASLNAAV